MSTTQTSYRVKIDGPLFTHCGFPVRKDVVGFMRYGTLHDVFSHVQYCKHEQTCIKCCFPFTGRVCKIENTNRKLSYISLDARLPTGGTIIISRFFYISIFGMDRRIVIRHGCKNQLCTNIAHMLISKRKMTQEDNFWGRVKVCPHGRDCSLCCWNWDGKHPNGVFIGKKHVKPLRLMYFSRFKKEKIRFYRFENACKNEQCVNLHHRLLGSQIYFGKFTGLLAKYHGTDPIEFRIAYLKYLEGLPHAC